MSTAGIVGRVDRRQIAARGHFRRARLLRVQDCDHVVAAHAVELRRERFVCKSQRLFQHKIDDVLVATGACNRPAI